MKKYIAFAVLTFGLIGSIHAMQEEQKPQEKEQSGFGFSDLIEDLGSFVSQVREDVASVFNSGQTEQIKEQSPIDQAKELVRQEQENNRLSQAIIDSTKQESPKQFLELLIDITSLNIHAGEENQTIISNYLDLLQQQHNAQTKEILLERISKGQKLHALRKKFSNGALSDDEDYSDLNKYASKLLSN